MLDAPAVPPKVQNGKYTVASPDGRHYTLKLYTRNFGGPNPAHPKRPDDWKRVLALMTGSDNQSGYTGIAFWDDDAQRVDVWRRHRAGFASVIDGYTWRGKWGKMEKKLAVWAELVIRGSFDGEGAHVGSGYWAGEGYTLLRSARCVRCNKELTNPESVQLGIGPVCGGRA